jgi:transcriptional regulator with XRE-family HTH domain
MIRTKGEYESTLAAISEMEAGIPAEEQRLRDMGCPEEKLDRMMGPYLSRLAEIRYEAQLYERIRSGDLSMFSSPDDDELVLVAARIARGLTQRQLAERLGVNESQISRDERNSYRGITVERRREIARALELEIQGKYRLGSRSSEVTAIRPKRAAPEEQVYRKAASMSIKEDEVSPRRRRQKNAGS